MTDKKVTKSNKDRIDSLEKRNDDFNIRNEKFYSDMKKYLEKQENRISCLERSTLILSIIGILLVSITILFIEHVV